MQRSIVFTMLFAAIASTAHAAIVKNPPGVPNGDIGNNTFPNASIEVNGGSVLDEEFGFTSFAVEVGRTLGSQGLLHVTGAGSEYNVMFRHFALGREGQGEVLVDDGGFFGLLTDSFGGRFLFINNDGDQGSIPTSSSAVVTVDGVGSKFQYGGDRTMPPGSSVLKGGMLIGEVGHARPTEIRVLNGGEFYSPNFLEDPIGLPARVDILGPNTRVTIEGGGSIFTFGVGSFLFETNQGPGNGGLRLARGGVIENRTGGSRFRTTLSLGIGDDGFGNTSAGTVVNEFVADFPTLEEITIDPGTTLGVGDSFLIAEYASASPGRFFGNAGPTDLFEADGYTFDFAYDVPLAGSPGRLGVFMSVIATLLPGDSNGDGVVSTLDIDPFVLALSDPDQYASDFPSVDFLGANDINGDGLVSTLDIDPFVALLSGQATSVPEPSALCLLILASVGLANATMVGRRRLPLGGADSQSRFRAAGGLFATRCTSLASFS